MSVSPEELNKETFAEFGLTYYHSEALCKGLGIFYALMSFKDTSDVIRPGLEEKLVEAGALTLRIVIAKVKPPVSSNLQNRLDQARDKRNTLLISFGMNAPKIFKESDFMKRLLLARLLFARLSPARLLPVGLLLAIVVLLAGCGQAAPTVTPTLTPSPSPTPSLTSTPNPALTPSPESTRAPAIPEAGIELISGRPDGCVNTDQNQSTVFGFNVVYHTVTTGNYQTATLVASDGAVLANVNSETENRDGEGLWGFYPSAFDYPANTALTMTLTTYSGIDATTPVSSISTLTYNCTTGEAISQTYIRGQ